MLNSEDRHCMRPQVCSKHTWTDFTNMLCHGLITKQKYFFFVHIKQCCPCVVFCLIPPAKHLSPLVRSSSPPHTHTSATLDFIVHGDLQVFQESRGKHGGNDPRFYPQYSLNPGFLPAVHCEWTCWTRCGLCYWCPAVDRWHKRRGDWQPHLLYLVCSPE